LALFFVVLGLAGHSSVQAQNQPLSHEDYDRWEEIDAHSISDDGEWVLYRTSPPKGDDTLYVKQVDPRRSHEVPRGEEARFTADAQFVAFMVAPPYDSTRQAKLDDVPPPRRPTDDLGLLDLSSGDTTRVDRVQSYKLPDEGRDWVAYHHEPPRPDSSEAEEDDGSDEEGDDGDADSAPLTIRHLDSGDTWRYDNVTDYAVAEEGPLLTYTVADSTEKSLHAVQLDGDTPHVTTLHSSELTYPQMALDDAGSQVAFLAGPDSTDVPHHENTLYHWAPGDSDPTTIVESGASALPEEWLVTEQAGLSFSEDGSRVFFGTAPTPPPPVEKDSLLKEEQVDLDVWHWQDPYLQPMQKERTEQKQQQSFRAVHFLETDRTLQLATEEIPAVTVADEGNADVALGVTNRPYRQALSWDWPPAYDAYLIDLQGGERERILQNVQSVPQLSPTGEYVAWWDRGSRDWKGLNTDTRERMTLSTSIPHPVFDHRHDRPYPPGPYGLAGWTEGDDQVLLYDRHDVWAVDPERPQDARAVTDALGRNNDLRLRHVSLDSDRDPAAWGDWPNPVTPTVVPDELLLSAFNVETKADGFYRDRIGGGDRPTELIMMDRSFSTPESADDADRLLYTRESVQEFPDLRVADRSFSDPDPLSTVNPQQSDYRWATVELVEWTSANGEQLEGLLYKPEDFDPDSGREYPMMTYFYEQYSDDLHEHHAPAADRSVINFTFYASRGYLVFVPDIHYEEGYPGESAMQSVMPGVTRLADRDYVDEDRIGVQGHSWGGYQIAYMVTKTDLFAAAEAGAPVSNMISAYGGIRWGTGMSRMFQYEDTQSRIGGSLWDMPMRYINNSPIFQADRIDTPLMMMHNDQDSAVPWEQGIELFVALRRLNKPAWLLNYTGEVHWPTDLAEIRDWTTRMQQFFDHYLKGAP
ncbi:MAG: prolyl oligopeptidase family serine peptidase, partial [Salinivenus sp.]